MDDLSSLRNRLSNLSSKSESDIYRLKKQSIVRLLDEICSLIVRLRDKRCMTCSYQNPQKKPTSQGLTNGHYYRRGIQSLRWDLRNCNAQCSKCNSIHEEDEKAYTAFMIGRYGESILDELQEKRREHSRYTRIDLVNIYFELVEVGRRL